VENDKILEFIETLKGRAGDDSGAKALEAIFTQGNCGRFALALKTLFPEGEICIAEENDHIMFGYDGRYYDIMGRFDNLWTFDRDKGMVPDRMRMIELTDEELRGYCDNFSIKAWGPRGGES
jgi:hypothetical protein